MALKNDTGQEKMVLSLSRIKNIFFNQMELYMKTRAANCCNICPSYPKLQRQNSIIKNNKGQ